MKTKVYKNILFPLFIAIPLCFNCLIILHPVQAEEGSIKLENSKSKIDHAAYYQAIGEQMARCVDDVKGFNNDNVFNGGEMMEIFQSGTKWYVGPWLEEEITGKVDDGIIRCWEGSKDEGDRNGKDGILRLFAEVIDSGEDLEEKIRSILCNWFDKDAPGLTQRDSYQRRYVTGCNRVWNNEKEVGSYFDDRGETVKFDKKDRFPGEYSTGWQYLKLVWDFWKNNEEYEQVDKYDEPNEYIDDLGDIEDTWDDADLHFLYRKDLEALCPFNDLGSNAQDDSFEILALNPEDASLKVEPIEFENEDKHAWGKLLDTKRQATCIDILAAVNETYEGYRDKIQQAFKKECDNNDAVRQAWKFNYTKSRLVTGDDPESNEPIIVTPKGTKFRLNNSIVKSKFESGQYNGDEYWRNFRIITDDDGNTKYEVLEFSEKDKKTAQKIIEDYGKYKKAGSFFSYKNEKNKDDGVVCNVPEGYTTSVIEGDQDSDSDSDPEAGDSDPCYDAGVEGMSWVLCPAINNTSNTVDKIEELLRGWLTIPVDGKDGIYAQAKDSNGKKQEGTYVGWDIFRNIANVFLAILFLFIIFSQLTGYGIDNYGIKKMLPKLIAIAIIINLSYILCKIAVDVSNILGVGLNNLFETIGRGIASAGRKDMNYTTSTIVGVLFGAIAGTGAVAGIALSAAGGGWVMVVVVLLLALLVALVGVLIFFVMLSVRIIIVAVFIVLAPLALACYILPNTKSLFQKWWKVFEAALLVFPICGALYGASFIVKAIVGGDGAAGSWTFMGAIAAVIAPFLPFFALPSLLKGALAGLGAIGGTLTALGGSLKKGAQSGSNAIQSGIKGTERYKNNMQERARSRQAKLTNRGIEKLENRQKKLAGKGKSLSAGEQQLLARRYQTKDKLENEDRAARTVVEQNRTSDMDLDGLMKEWNNAWNGGDSKKLDAMTSVINSRYGASGASQIANSLAGKDVASDEQAQSMMGILQNNMNHDSTFANNMRNKAADAYSMISDGGRVREKNGKFAYKNLDHFTKSQTAAEKDKDWATQSKDTIRRAIKEGKLGKEQIERMLYDTNPNIQSELNGDGKRGVLEEALKDMGGPSSTTPSSTSGGIITADSLEGRQEIERQRKKGRII